MKHKKEIKLFEPFEVGDLVVYLTGENRANVIDVDCRWELQTTTSGCDCCTYRFRSRMDKNFKCRHMKALMEVLKSEEV